MKQSSRADSAKRTLSLLIIVPKMVMPVTEQVLASS